MRFLLSHAQHIGTRSSQQDSFGFGPADPDFVAHGGQLAIVCDGMGGMEFGDDASRIAVRAFLIEYGEKEPREGIPAALERSATHANSQVAAFALGLNLVGGVGTTLVAAAVVPQGFYFISIGDSGVFSCSQGRVKEINRPHVFANYLAQAVASGKMTEQAALSHPERDALTSYVGTTEMQEVDRNLKLIPLHPGESVVLASDGMFKTLSADEIEACLEGYPPDWPQVLVDRTIAYRKTSQDNVTVVSVTLEDEARPLVRSEPRPNGSSAVPPPLPKG